MDKKITKITIKNYRAFYNQPDTEPYTIEVPNGENLLIYGENGSGKSSLYHALYDFLEASDFPEKQFIENLFSQTVIDDEKYIEIEFSDIEKDATTGIITIIPKPYKFDKSNKPEADFIKDTLQIKAFLSYRDILNTHILETNYKNPNLFEIIVKVLLKDYMSIFTLNISIKDYYETISRTITEVKRFEESRKKHTDTLIDNFNMSVDEGLNLIKDKTNEYLEIFNSKIKITVPQDTKFLRRENKLLSGNLRLNIVYANREVNVYQLFLNEARLSALAISMYLAAIYKSTYKPEYKILFLDDIFIGLDTSNRIPLLKILNEDFKDFQIVMTTYDKQWYEVAKQFFGTKSKDNWKYFEMYVDDFTYPYEIPVIIPFKSNIDKAEKYLAKHDYPACGIYLRKECERILDYLLKPEHHKRVENNKQCKTNPKNLNALINNFKSFCENENIEYKQFEDLGVYKDAVLNPLSHNDINLPIYKEELLSIIRILKKLNDIQIIEVPNKQKKEPLLVLNNGDYKYSAELKICDKVFIIVENNTKRLLNACKVLLKTTRINNQNEKTHNQMFNSLIDAHKFFCQHFGIEYNPDELLSNLKFRGISLMQKIEEIQIVEGGLK